MLTTTAPGTSSDKSELQARVYRPDEIEGAWSLLEPFIERCTRISNGRLSTELTKVALLNGWACAMATYRGEKLELVLVVEIVNYPALTVARVVAIAGRGLKESARFLDALDAWAFTLGAVEIECYCRPAMARLIRRFGWRTEDVRLTRNLRRKLQ